MNAAVGNKKKKTIILSFILVLVIIVGATLAYLFTKTDSVSNVFTFADNIKAVLDEPNWKPEEALNLVPGKVIEKDPQITNTSENGVVEYAGIKLTFLDGANNEISADDMITLMSLIEIDWSSNWTLVDGTTESAQQIYVFNDTLPQGVTTDPVFYTVTIPSSITNDQLTWLLGNYGHEDSCYTAGTHADALCTITYRHHEKCALNNGSNTAADIAGTAAGATLNGTACDCVAVTVHESTCPSLIKTLSGDCDDHNTIISGLGNFTIKVEGAVVQADAFDELIAPNPPASGVEYASDALIQLFNTAP